MKHFVLIFRMDINTAGAQPTPEQMKHYMIQWDEWIQFISGKGQLAEGGNHLSPEGRLLKPGSVTEEGPYISDDLTSVAGYILIYAKDLDEATSLAGKCPILEGVNTSVEIRETGVPV